MQNRAAGSVQAVIFAALMIPGVITGAKREPGANPGLFLKL